MSSSAFLYESTTVNKPTDPIVPVVRTLASSVFGAEKIREVQSTTRDAIAPAMKHSGRGLGQRHVDRDAASEEIWLLNKTDIYPAKLL